MIQLVLFYLLKQLTWANAHLAERGGIFKSLEIEYKEINDLALLTPATIRKALLIIFLAD